MRRKALIWGFVGEEITVTIKVEVRNEGKNLRRDLCARGNLQEYPQQSKRFFNSLGLYFIHRLGCSTKGRLAAVASIVYPGGTVLSEVDPFQAFMLRFPPMLTQRIKIQGTTADEAALEIASSAILSGSVISLPTDTFYALGADPFNLRAVEQIFQIKGRQPWKPLLLLIDSMEQAESIAQKIPDLFYEIAEEFWPGPLTIVLPAAKHVPLKITGGTGTVGIRIPDSDLARGLVHAIDVPIVGTSANRTAYPSCSSAEEVLEQFGGKIELILDSGKLAATAPSTIIDLTKDPPALIREGAIARDRLERYLCR